MNAFSLWKPEAVRVTSGAEHVATFAKTPMSERQYCAKCGGHLMANHPPLGLVDVFAATLPTLDFVPGVHVNYAETVLPMRDGLPKLKDFPRSSAVPATYRGSPNSRRASEKARVYELEAARAAGSCRSQ